MKTSNPKPTVLIADDEPGIRLLIRASLEDAGYDLLEAEDGRDALRIAHAQRPDAILLDIAMPHLSGLEVCRRLRKEPATSQTPVLLLTGLGSDGQAARDAGAQGCITKPFAPADLAARLAQALA